MEGGQAMTCQSCKGTGQIVLLYSTVACEDCAKPGNWIGGSIGGGRLKSAPMLKCGFQPGFQPGDRVRHPLVAAVGVVDSMAEHGHVFVRFDGDGLLPQDRYSCAPNLLERVEDTI